MTTTIHVRYEGTSRDLQANLPSGADDLEVKQAIAHLLEDINPNIIADYAVDRSAGGAITVRPQAVYG